MTESKAGGRGRAEGNELVELGKQLQQVIQENKGVITGAFVMLLSEEDRFLIAHGDNTEIGMNVLDSLKKLANPQKYVDDMLSGEVRNGKGETVVNANQKGQ